MDRNLCIVEKMHECVEINFATPNLVCFYTSKSLNDKYPIEFVVTCCKFEKVIYYFKNGLWLL